jgi:hypothetical protein
MAREAAVREENDFPFCRHLDLNCRFAVRASSARHLSPIISSGNTTVNRLLTQTPKNNGRMEVV